MSEKLGNAPKLQIILLSIGLAACTTSKMPDACIFTEPPAEDLLRGRTQHLLIVDAETGEVASYDELGNPVLEGGQPLALWAEFNVPTAVEICVLEVGRSVRPVHQSEVTFSEEINMQPLGRYDLGSYLLHISTNGKLAKSILFTIQ